MTRALLVDLAVVFALESVEADLAGDPDEAFRLSAIAKELRDRAEAVGPRAVARMVAQCGHEETAHDDPSRGVGAILVAR